MSADALPETAWTSTTPIKFRRRNDEGAGRAERREVRLTGSQAASGRHGERDYRVIGHGRSERVGGAPAEMEKHAPDPVADDRRAGDDSGLWLPAARRAPSATVDVPVFVAPVRRHVSGAGR